MSGKKQMRTSSFREHGAAGGSGSLMHFVPNVWIPAKDSIVYINQKNSYPEDYEDLKDERLLVIECDPNSGITRLHRFVSATKFDVVYVESKYLVDSIVGIDSGQMLAKNTEDDAFRKKLEKAVAECTSISVQMEKTAALQYSLRLKQLEHAMQQEDNERAKELRNSQVPELQSKNEQLQTRIKELEQKELELQRQLTEQQTTAEKMLEEHTQYKTQTKNFITQLQTQLRDTKAELEQMQAGGGGNGAGGGGNGAGGGGNGAGGGFTSRKRKEAEEQQAGQRLTGSNHGISYVSEEEWNAELLQWLKDRCASLFNDREKAVGDYKLCWNVSKFHDTYPKQARQARGAEFLTYVLENIEGLAVKVKVQWSKHTVHATAVGIDVSFQGFNNETGGNWRIEVEKEVAGVMYLVAVQPSDIVAFKERPEDSRWITKHQPTVLEDVRFSYWISSQ